MSNKPQGKVVTLPRYNLADVVSSLRQLANRIETGELACDDIIVVRAFEGAYTGYSSFGDGALKMSGWVGCLEMAKLQALAESGYLNGE